MADPQSTFAQIPLDTLSDAQHSELDTAIYANQGGPEADMLPLTILFCVVDGDPRILQNDSGRSKMSKAKTLLQAHEGLSEFLKAAWKSGSLKSIRNLAILHLPTRANVDALVEKYSFQLILRPDLTDDDDATQDKAIILKLNPTVTAATILSQVVTVDRRLNKIYIDEQQAEELLRIHAGLAEVTETAWQTGHLAVVRRLAILNRPRIDLDALLKKYYLVLIPRPDLGDEDIRTQDAAVRSQLGDNAPPDLVVSLVVDLDFRLDRNYEDRKKVRELFQRHTGLAEVIQACYDMDQLTTIRRLLVLRKKWKFDAVDDYIDAQKQATIDAWEYPFIDNHHVVFAEDLHRINREREKNPYNNYIPVMQSSGTGKSRLVHETAGLIFTLPFNVREDMGIYEFAYPLPDRDVRDYLVARRASYEMVCERMVAFFAALFKHARAGLETLVARVGQQDTVQSLALRWRQHLDEHDCYYRNSMYEATIEEADSLLGQSQYRNMGEWKMVDALGKSVVIEATELISAISAAVTTKKTDSLDILNPKPEDPVLLLLYFDEAHVLSNTPTTTTWPKTFTHFDALCLALSFVSQLSILAVTLTTNPDFSKQSVGTYGPRLSQFPRGEIEWQPPWTVTPFDLLKDGLPFFTENELTLDEVGEVGFMAKFGRPLWVTRYELGNRYVRRFLIDFARMKLAGRKSTAREKWNSKLAAYSMRLLLQLDPLRELGRMTDIQLVEGYMKTVFSVSTQGDYILHAGYPSEPILAEAAAFEMDHWVRDARGQDDVIAQDLQEFLDEGLLYRENRGELVMRLLLTLAYDKAAKPRSKEEQRARTKDGVLYSRPVLLVDFLRALISEKWIDNVLACKPDNATAASPELQDAFETARVRFTHFARHTPDNPFDTGSALAAVVRGMAVLDDKDYPGMINCMIPIAMTYGTLSEEVMSCILIQVIDSQRPACNIDQAEVNMEGPFFPADIVSDGSMPYIALHMDLGPQSAEYVAQRARATTPTSPSPSSEASPSPSPTPLQASPSPPPTQSEASASTHSAGDKTHNPHPIYRIKIDGCSPSVYGVVENKNIYATLLDSRPPQPQRGEFHHAPESYNWIASRTLRRDESEDVYVGEWEGQVIAGPIIAEQIIVA